MWTLTRMLTGWDISHFAMDVFIYCLMATFLILGLSHIEGWLFWGYGTGRRLPDPDRKITLLNAGIPAFGEIFNGKAPLLSGSGEAVALRR